MRKTHFTLSLVVGLAASTAAQATLIDRGNGLIYDNVLNITWLQNANLAATDTFGVGTISSLGAMTWTTAEAWIAAMNAADYKGYNDWRLPTTGPVNGSTFNYTPSYAGDTDVGFNISAPGTAHAGSTGSQLAYMYYVNLGLKSYYDTSGNQTSDWGIFGNGTCNGTDCSSLGPNNVGLIDNLQSNAYWSDTDYAPVANDAWAFDMVRGEQGGLSKNVGTFFYAWAVRPGDIHTVPEPATLALMGLGLATLGLARRNS